MKWKFLFYLKKAGLASTIILAKLTVFRFNENFHWTKRKHILPGDLWLKFIFYSTLARFVLNDPLANVGPLTPSRENNLCLRRENREWVFLTDKGLKTFMILWAKKNHRKETHCIKRTAFLPNSIFQYGFRPEGRGRFRQISEEPAFSVSNKGERPNPGKKLRRKKKPNQFVWDSRGKNMWATAMDNLTRCLNNLH